MVHPLVQELAHMSQRAKQVCGEHFMAKGAIKAFGIGILRRLAGLNPVHDNALLLKSLAQVGTDELGSVIRAQLREETMTVD
jgi:hypothetical protein